MSILEQVLRRGRQRGTPSKPPKRRRRRRIRRRDPSETELRVGQGCFVLLRHTARGRFVQVTHGWLRRYDFDLEAIADIASCLQRQQDWIADPTRPQTPSYDPAPFTFEELRSRRYRGGGVLDPNNLIRSLWLQVTRGFRPSKFVTISDKFDLVFGHRKRHQHALMLRFNGREFLGAAYRPFNTIEAMVFHHRIRVALDWLQAEEYVPGDRTRPAPSHAQVRSQGTLPVVKRLS